MIQACCIHAPPDLLTSEYTRDSGPGGITFPIAEDSILNKFYGPIVHVVASSNLLDVPYNDYVVKFNTTKKSESDANDPLKNLP